MMKRAKPPSDPPRYRAISAYAITAWEQGAHRPDKAAQVLLTAIARDPDAVARALEG